MNCSLIRSYLQEYAAGTLPAYKAGWVVQHLAGCEDCSARLQEHHQEAEAVKAAAQAEALELAAKARRRRRGRPPRHRPETQSAEAEREVAVAVPPEPALIPRASRRAAMAAAPEPVPPVEPAEPTDEESVAVQRPIPRALKWLAGALLLTAVGAGTYYLLPYWFGK